MSKFLAGLLYSLLEKFLSMLFSKGMDYYNQKMKEKKNKERIEDALKENDRRRAAERINDAFAD